MSAPTFKRTTVLILIFLLALLPACQPAGEQILPTNPPPASPTPLPDTATPAPTLAPTPAFTPTPTYVPPTLREPPLALPPGVTLEEYALKAAPEMEPLTFVPLVGTQAEILRRRAAERDYTNQLVETDNQVLQAYGYQVEITDAANRKYRLVQGDKVLLEDVVWVSPISAGTSDFLLYLDASSASYILRKDGLITRDWVQNAQYGNYAAYMGADLMSATETYAGTGSAMKGTATVYRNGAPIFFIPTGQPSPSPDLLGLWTFGGEHWAIEVNSQVIVDGQSLNVKEGYQESFSFHLINGAPFYFFKKDGKIGASYDGRPIALDYDEIPHYGCCSAGALNPGYAPDMIWYYARLGETWYYVELGSYPSS
jgi:hypothetical protein